MDARKYASRYVKPDNVRDGPIQTRIVNVLEDERYGRLMLELETGSQFALNDGNANALIKAWAITPTNGLAWSSRWSSGLTRIGALIRRRKKKLCGSAPSRKKRMQTMVAHRPVSHHCRQIR
jgi:hypothetical protein